MRKFSDGKAILIAFHVHESSLKDYFSSLEVNMEDKERLEAQRRHEAHMVRACIIVAIALLLALVVPAFLTRY